MRTRGPHNPDGLDWVRVEDLPMNLDETWQEHADRYARWAKEQTEARGGAMTRDHYADRDEGSEDTDPVQTVREIDEEIMARSADTNGGHMGPICSQALGFIRAEWDEREKVMDDRYALKDSGKREEMQTGSVRDTRENKGRFELISPFALARLAAVYEKGAAKYASRNWEKGQPISRCLDSALRHLNRYAMGWTDEDHAAQALWNIAAIIHFEECIKLGLLPAELDDMPKYTKGPQP